METNTQNENRIFQYTFAGAVLFIAAVVFTLTNSVNITKLEMPYTIMASVLGASAVSLLYKAIKFDGERVKSV